MESILGDAVPKRYNTKADGEDKEQKDRAPLNSTWHDGLDAMGPKSPRSAKNAFNKTWSPGSPRQKRALWVPQRIVYDHEKVKAMVRTIKGDATSKNEKKKEGEPK